VDEIGSGNPSDLSIVIGRGNFHDICSNEVQASQTSDDTFDFSSRPYSCLWSPSGRCKSGVNNIDIKAQIYWGTPDAFSNTPNDFSNS